MDEKSTADAPGKAEDPGADGGAAARLRIRGVEAAANPEPRKRGRPAGSGNKTEKTEKPAAAAKPSKNPEFVYSKTGKAFRALSHIASLQTNNRVWQLTEGEEKDLGEAVGDIFLELGLTDTMAAKVVFAIGSVSAIYGSKAIAYAAYVASQPKPMRAPIPAETVKAQAPATSAPDAPGAVPTQEPKSGDAGVHESKPGTL